MEIDGKKSTSKTLYNSTLESSSILFQKQAVRLYNEAFNLGRFLEGKIRIRKNKIKWKCPRSFLSGSLSLKNIYKNMKEGKGFYIDSDAVSYLKFDAGIDSSTDNLVYLCSRKSSIYISFHDWNLMDVWVTDFLVLLKQFACTTVAPKKLRSNTSQYWIYDLGYRRLMQDNIELEIELNSQNKQFYATKISVDLENECIVKEFENSISKSNIFIDNVATELLQMFISNCRQEIMAYEMSRDVLSLHSKKIVFGVQTARTLFKKNAQWYSCLEKKHKATLITAQLDAINESRSNDTLLQCLRLVELQKYTLQLHLRKLSIQMINADLADENIQGFNKRLSEISKQREQVNSRSYPNKTKDCSCNCLVF